jgi:hypothetical protein
MVEDKMAAAMLSSPLILASSPDGPALSLLRERRRPGGGEGGWGELVFSKGAVEE